MKPLLATGSVVRNLLNLAPNTWPAKAIDSSRPMQWQDRRPLSPQPTKSPNTIAVHADEMLSPDGHEFDRIALKSVMDDPEVKAFMSMMGDSAMIPVKRKKP